MAHAGTLSFQAHLELLQFFLAHRDAIAERIQGLLNAQRQPNEYLRNSVLLSRQFEDCFFAIAAISQSQSRLRGQLDEAHWASGFRPRQMPGLYNGLADPAEMMIRGFHLWQQTRWPGRNGRLRYAHTLFNLYVIRCLELLSMRVWDDAPGGGDRLGQLQDVLDRLWAQTPADQPVLVRDARWLIPLAQSPATDDLGAYFMVAQRVAETLPLPDRIAVHKAAVRMTGGHLRSQIRHYSLKHAVPLDEPTLILNTRTSNALDFALLIQDLVPLLEAYEQACRRTDVTARVELADAICQGISPDPELFLNRVDLLAAYSMIDYLFITAGSDGQAAYTPMGDRHVRLVQRYEALIGRVAKPLSDDSPHLVPVAGAYSPYGVLYGFSSHLIEHIVLKALQPETVTRFSLEDVFASGGAGAEKLAWVSGWRKLPHITREIERLFDYPQPFAEEMFARLERALRRRTSEGDAHAAAPSGHLFVFPDDGPPADAAALIPDLPLRFVQSSDPQVVAAKKAEFREETQLLRDRREGHHLLSYRTAGGWVAISKAVLTEVLGTGQDMKIALPAAAGDALQLMSAGLVQAPSRRHSALRSS
jgi:hypothetical protein